MSTHFSCSVVHLEVAADFETESVCVCVCVERHFRNSVFVLLFKPNYKHKQKLLNDTLTATLQVQQRESSEHA